MKFIMIIIIIIILNQVWSLQLRTSSLSPGHVTRQAPSGRISAEVMAAADAV